MESRKKKSTLWMCIAIVLLIVSMVGSSLVQSSGGKVDVKDINWVTSSGYEMSALLLTPQNASAETPAPAVVVCHGFYNSKEMQDAYYVELARRGYVVLAIDMYSHGDSESVMSVGDIVMSVNDAVKYISTLNYVDVSKIGVEGHSLGSASCNIAAQIDSYNPSPLIAAVVLNSAGGTYVNAESGEFTNIYGSKDVAIIAAQYDEFGFVEMDENGNPSSPIDFIKYENAQSFLHFGTDPQGKETRQSDTIYVEMINGTKATRAIYTPAMTHPWVHFSSEATKNIIEFFDASLGSPIAIASVNQIWQLKEAFNLIGLISLAVFALSFVVLMLFTPFFSSLKVNDPIEPREVGKGNVIWYFGTMIASVIFGAATYVPICTALQSDAYFKMFSDQNTVFAIAVWAAACGLFSLICSLIGYVVFGRKNDDSKEKTGLGINLCNLGKTILLSIIAVAVSYSWVFAADYFFNTDFRIWVLAARAFVPETFISSLFPYAPLFIIYFTANSIAVNSFGYYKLGKKSSGTSSAFISALFATLPAVILLSAQYIYFFSTGFILFTGRSAALMLLWLLPLLLILPASVIISRKLYRVTNNPYLSGLICGLLATFISCANTCIWA